MANTTIASFLNQTTASPETCVNVANYFCSDKGIILPIFVEATWPIALRAFLYLFAMLYCFMGVAIIADVFMCSIEVITSKTKTISIVKPGTDIVEEVEVRIWNDTVANLTLMALGSSAPEILLSIVGIIKTGFKSEELGPSTIVGSAAFNLLIITGVCVSAIPAGEVRKIKAVKVFAVTAFFSIFAYAWLYIVLVLNTKDVMDLWEAIVTFMFFPILVILAYIADKDYCSRRVDVEKETDHLELEESQSGTVLAEYAGMAAELKPGHVNKQSVSEFVKEISKYSGGKLSPEEAAKLAALKIQENEKHDRSWYRVNATRWLVGGRKVSVNVNNSLKEKLEGSQVYDKAKNKDEVPLIIDSASDLSQGGTFSVVEFSASSCAVMESQGTVEVSVLRSGRTNTRVPFRYETIDGTAEAGSDYIPQKDVLVFEPGESMKNIKIVIVDDNQWETDETFFVKLSVDPDSGAVLGRKSINEITIINDDDPGVLDFTKPSFIFKESAGIASVPVQRTKGSDGVISVKWKTKDMRAVNGRDYVGGEGVLEFQHGETEKNIDIQIFDDKDFEKDEDFMVELSDAAGGAMIGRQRRTVVTIVNDDEYNGLVDRVLTIVNVNMDHLQLASSTWGGQFRDAMNVNGGDVENATTMDYVMHFLTFGWKVMFALTPPVNFLGGWLTFIVSLMGFIFLLTVIISDLATTFGCLIELEDNITAITLVAMGTSLPDLFASRTAARAEKYADASIGNVTGSNSVNVFLGLGLPWLIASIYWEAQGEKFAVPAGSLAFSVMAYSICAILCIIILVIRRIVPAFGRAELGGTPSLKYVSSGLMASLWVLYIVLAILETKKVIVVPL
ncbi:sodium/calcium exchanger 3-like isoform X5 [Branchiostoma floridae]|uniref:Sodium/calcium exchanger 3-like isoform X5 n=1 Tax=Branchiostoma floridae TaxID=7739 RepID=A0A9J7MA96_BRAFL|nr:sodium/calcium exchanger 3-like isoform X5 [Branchiostoma floridae]